MLGQASIDTAQIQSGYLGYINSYEVWAPNMDQGEFETIKYLIGFRMHGGCLLLGDKCELVFC